MRLAGNSKKGCLSPFVRFLQIVFQCEIDVQVGNGRLNYINGYVAKDHDSLDVGLGEYVQKASTAPWLATYRLLCKSAPCLPEVAIRMAQLPEFDRSYSHVLLYPPLPAQVLTFEQRQKNFSSKMYGFYCAAMKAVLEHSASRVCLSQSFLQWHRDKEYDAGSASVRHGGLRHQQKHRKTPVVSCRYWYEQVDGYWGQFALTQLPHSDPEQLVPGDMHLGCMINFSGMIEYLGSWKWFCPGVVAAAGNVRFSVDALPLCISDTGDLISVGTYAEGQPVFASRRIAFEFAYRMASRDLQYRGFRDDRLATFFHKQEANLLLYERVFACADSHEHELLQQSWDFINRPQHRDFQWGDKQQEVLDLVKERVSYDDEDQKQNSRRWLYIKGPPGSGKSALLLEVGIRCAKQGLSVLIVCPTGTNVYSFKSQLPQFEGVDKIRVDTIQGVLNYKRSGSDSKISWSPPSAMRKIDVILCDEASQYEDSAWSRFFSVVKEQPHLPYTCVVADFQQLQPVSSGGLCESFCKLMETIELETVHRSADPDHLLFLNRIRHVQPTRVELVDYFGDRHWGSLTLPEAVARGQVLAEETGHPFTWLCHNNKGAADVCQAALSNMGITSEELASGFLCDPSSRSGLRILAKPGVMLRLTRNLDKSRGFVNGALAVVCESLRGNAVFMARLVGSGTYVLVHPMEEDSAIFLPCCYGYATTVRRAQGLSLVHGCLYFDQAKRAAGRGYGYVACSRFKTQSGCHLWGKVRRTDFLPVGEESEHEVLQRGYLSESSDDECGGGMDEALGSCGAAFGDVDSGDEHGVIAVDFA